MLKINNKKYYLDTEVLFRFVMEPIENNHRDKANSEIIEYYKPNAIGDSVLLNKEIREVKVNATQIDSIKYDFVRLLLEEAFGMSLDEMLYEDDVDVTSVGGIELEYGNVLAFNTLLKLEIIKQETT